MSRYINSRKEDLESIATMIAALWWQGIKEKMEKCFAKADFKRTETTKSGIATYDEDNCQEIIMMHAGNFERTMLW